MKRNKVVGRIRYVEDYRDIGEAYCFEIKSEGEWGLDTAFRMIDDMISYQALTKIREWQRNGVEFHWE